MKIEKLYDKEISDILEYEDFIKVLKENPDENFLKEVHRKYQYRSQEEALRTLQVELIKLQDHLEKHNEKMIILVEGRDASGKGGAIRRITRYMNEKHYRVVALGKPSDVERSQWYFQRYVQQFPKAGEIVIFDRSWYNRSMVEPVFGFCTDKQYETFMNTVTSFEEDLIEHGIHFLKIYFSVSKEEQSNRFKEREENPLKQWKLSEIDLQMQERWNEFTEKKYRMLKETNTEKSPWTIIRSDDKFVARYNAIKTILNKVDYQRRDSRIDFSVDPEIVITAEKELEIMAKSSKININK
ncbi:polyphosphate kinase 2 [Halarcobacter mediterraneus]|uniref:ADP/GDP-polyphosphate phosphotransferase n=1 Tax=Halarcobacter mediterraneus TaxID=2023153 RepID=A0A4Q1B1G7_9BACT|nr:polyphosphate kinase 2 [Halarcobacter mediterraneus]RXK11617.1 polyphosphate kinase 2 [Halarcobacter mediterraneus]